MCCEPRGSTDKVVGECPECGGQVDAEGISVSICGYAPRKEACPVCEGNPCTGYC